VLGLTAGIFLLGWILSGWLSMDHGRLFSRGGASDAAVAAMRGKSLAEAIGAISPSDIALLQPASSVEFRVLAGNDFMRVVRPEGRSMIHSPGSPALEALPDEWLLAGVRAAYPHATSIESGVSNSTPLYSRAEELPDTARLYLVKAPDLHRVYVDAGTGEILVDMDASRRAYAWIYYALHTYQVPGLAGRDALRIPLILLLLAAGFALSVTGVVIGYRRLRSTVS
jgi:hypothetical protein